MNHPSLLIIRDDEQNLQDLKKLLLPKKFGFSEVPQHADIEPFFRREHPDLVIVCSSDVSNAGELQATAEIRRQDRNVPIILVTQFSSEARAIAAFRAGINDYFKIPYSAKSLLERVTGVGPR